MKVSNTKLLEKDLEESEYIVYTILRQVSQSGESRNIDCYIILKNKPYCISYDVAQILGYKQTKDGSIKVVGCGMDMGYHLVNSLSIALYCNEVYTQEGAYKLEQRWL
jgi:hypothetical protein